MTDQTTDTPVRLQMLAMHVAPYHPDQYGIFGAQRRKTRVLVHVTHRARQYAESAGQDVVEVVRAFVPKLMEYAMQTGSIPSNIPERYKIETDGDPTRYVDRIHFVLTGRNLKGFEVRAHVDLGGTGDAARDDS